jgi:sugar phosphate isomerase/epimerase
MSGVVSVSAATLGFAPGPKAVELAAAAGFDHTGIRWDLNPPDADETRRTRAALRRTGVQILDVEVALLGTGHDQVLHARLLESATEVEARFLLCVGEGPDRSAIVDQLGRLADLTAGTTVRLGLEWMPFRSVATLEDARSILAEVGSHRAGLVVDALHLARSGGTPSEVALRRNEVLYVQLCDAPAELPDGLDLATEARTARLVLGDGELPLKELLSATGAAPLSIEVPAHGTPEALVDHAQSCRSALRSLIR